MANIVIASQDKLCQSAGNWFISHLHYQTGPINSLQTGETLVIIAHDAELGDGTALLSLIPANTIPNTNFTIKLIVCSAASHDFGKELLTPAERIANYFNKPVWAAKSLVYGQWDASGATFTGAYLQIAPHTDVTSLMGSLHL